MKDLINSSLKDSGAGMMGQALDDIFSQPRNPRVSRPEWQRSDRRSVVSHPAPVVKKATVDQAICDTLGGIP
jgi:hypothetical protein